ncbi:MAG: ABC transporter substrate-binding protein [Actinobacteria bacterium]|nr:MAG: ABC transporter substrate-binding protein [Actinomycetota bacterium]
MKRMAVLVSLLLVGCSTSPPSVDRLVTISKTVLPIGPKTSANQNGLGEDLSGAQLSNLDSTRIVTLANGAAESLVAMGLGDRLVGRDIASTLPEIANVPVVAMGHQVSAEKVLATSPTEVIVDASTGPKSALQQIATAGVSVVVIPEAWTVASAKERVLALGRAVGAEDVARGLIADIPAFKISPTPRVIFLYLRGPSSIYLLGGKGSGADEIISLAGGVDAGAAISSKPFSSITAETIAQANPDLILVMAKGLASVDGVKGLVSLPGVAQTNAGKNRRVVAVDDSLLLSFGPRLPDLISQLNAAMIKVMK